jgi:hypothetical protein
VSVKARAIEVVKVSRTAPIWRSSEKYGLSVSKRACKERKGTAIDPKVLYKRPDEKADFFAFGCDQEFMDDLRQKQMSFN